MITVTCPNCSVENSALSKRCISCGSELILEGYVRCDNCRALTPEKLEFCELCGSYLALAPRKDNHASPDRTGIPAPPIIPFPSSSSDVPHTHEDHQDTERGDRDEKPRLPSPSSPERSDVPADPSVPDWLLDVDAALKHGPTTTNLDEGVEKSSTEAFPSFEPEDPDDSVPHEELLKRLDLADSSEDPVDDPESQEWISAMGPIASESAAGTADIEQRTADDEAKTEESDSKLGADLAAGAAALTLGGKAIAKRRGGATQPLDAEGNLLGVPQQLAGTALPAWLSDQLQRPEEDFEDELIDEIVLPEPTRSTILTPAAPPPSEEDASPEDAVLDPSFEQWLQAFSEEPVAPDWMDDDEVVLEETLASDSVLSSAETPAWLHDIHEEEGDSAELLGITETVEKNGRLEGIEGAIQVETAIAATLIHSPKIDPALSEQHRKQIALLEGIVHAEPVKKRRKQIAQPKSMSAMTRVILAGALIIVIIIAMLIPSSVEWIQGGSVNPPTVALTTLHSSLNQAAGAPILVAFDYTPSMSGELSPIAQTLLEQLAENQSLALTVSQSAAGSEMSLIVSDEVDGLETISLGYLPGEAVGLRSLSECLDQSEVCETLFGAALQPDVGQSLSEVTRILILTSDSESLIAWIEQVGSHHEDMVLLAGVTQTLGPVVAPYLASEQLTGVLVGLPDLVAYERDLMEIEDESLESVGGFTLTIWLVAGFLLAGTIYYALTGLKNSRSR